MSKKRAELIVALDVDTLEEARKLIDALSPAVDIFKVGSQLFTSCGPAAVRFLQARGKKVFLDLKYHDIPNTVASAVSCAVGLTDAVKATHAESSSLFMLTLHTVGGKEMLEAAVRSVKEKAKAMNIEKPFLVGVTVLTSQKKDDNTSQLVIERALLAKECGLDGVVASSQEVALIRQKLGENFLIVTPGIRPTGADAGDQKRVTTPKDAIKNGSNFLVVGRPIVEAADPLAAAQNILKEINIA
ncbi:MAG: orotidine-5'-phosphate decarboxylase [Candidatus Omnitrophota bacterium]